MIDKKLLKLIEGLTILYENGHKKLKDAEGIIESIYKYSHLAGTCKNKHRDWRRQAKREIKELRKMKII